MALNWIQWQDSSGKTPVVSLQFRSIVILFIKVNQYIWIDSRNGHGYQEYSVLCQQVLKVCQLYALADPHPK